MDQIADYVVERTMRRGNHGVMYVARPPARLGLGETPVVVKLLDHHATDVEFRRIANELRLMNSAGSPQIVKLLDAGNQAGRLFMVMPYYAEGSLDAAFGERAAPVVVQCVADAARGAHALHELGVAHRDIKPANVLVDNGRGVLTDLGLAQMVGNPTSTITVGFGPVGALEFMDPALAWGEPAGRGTDIWSLGATLHRALTGSGIFETVDTSSMLSAVRDVMHADVHIAQDCPPALLPILRRTLRVDEDRYGTAEMLADDLEAAIAQGNL